MLLSWRFNFCCTSSSLPLWALLQYSDCLGCQLCHSLHEPEVYSWHSPTASSSWIPKETPWNLGWNAVTIHGRSTGLERGEEVKTKWRVNSGMERSLSGVTNLSIVNSRGTERDRNLEKTRNKKFPQGNPDKAFLFFFFFFFKKVLTFDKQWKW